MFSESKHPQPTHPGHILLKKFLKPMKITQVALAEHLGIPPQRINEIVKGKRGISPETAWLFSQALGTTPQYWLNLQMNYDLVIRRPNQQVGLMAVLQFTQTKLPVGMGHHGD